MAKNKMTGCGTILGILLLLSVLITYVPKILGGIMVLAGIGAIVYLFKNKETFNDFSVLKKTGAVTGIVFLMLFGSAFATTSPEDVNTTDVPPSQTSQTAQEQEKTEPVDDLSLEENKTQEPEVETEPKATAKAPSSSSSAPLGIVSSTAPSPTPTPTPAPKQETVQPSIQNQTSAEVYVTNSGEKYHRAGCSSLRKSKIPISLEDAKSSGHEPCKKCNPPQ